MVFVFVAIKFLSVPMIQKLQAVEWSHFKVCVI